MTSQDSHDNGNQPPTGDQYSSVVQDDAHVELQVGVMHGDAHFYHTATETPEEKYRVGLNYLHANAQQPAEKLICQAFMSGHRTTAVAYHWALAILSGRSFDHLGQDDFNGLTTAFQYAEQHGADQWSDATKAVAHLMACLVEQDSYGEADPIKLGAALAAFDALPGEQREEIRRHLEMILAGGIQDRFDAEYAKEVSRQRMSDNRKKRAWKYFEPDPTAPRLRLPKPIAIGATVKLGFLFGVLATGTGLVLLVRLLAGGEPLYLAVAALLTAVGGFAAVTQRWEWLRWERECDARRLERDDVPERDRRLDEREQEFATQVKKAIDHEFGYFRPNKWHLRKEWNKRIDGIKNALHRELVEVYGADAEVKDVTWLIRHYARQAFGAWRNGTLDDDNVEPPAPAGAVLLVPVGASAAVGGVAIALFVAFQANWSMALLGTLALLGGGAVLLPTATTVYLEWRRHADQSAAMTRRYEEQVDSYEKLVRVLADRPTDIEMARWLDYDKAHVRMLALQRYQLNNRNVIAHAVLSQGTGFCRVGRVPYGPPRYSSYLLYVFLLTDRGARQVRFEVNFLDGLVHNEQRMTFHYEAVTNMEVGVINVRLDGEQLSLPPDRSGQRWLHQLALRRKERSRVAKPLVLSRTVRLSLVNDSTIAIRVATFDDGLVDRMRENPWNMLELALDVAGSSSALRILESVAAEGKEWISQERDRRTRRLKTYQEEMGWWDMQ